MPNTDPLYKQAIERFIKLFEKVKKTDLDEPTAVALATSDSRAHPSVRMVLLKGVDERGFVFYTNKKSVKGQEISQNPHAALCFYWPPLHRQVTVQGRVEDVTGEEADSYWASRPRNSQVGGWASLQSEPLKGWKELIVRIAKFEIEFFGKKVPRPPHWSGCRLIPSRIEFWKAGPFRIHKRVVYWGEKGIWKVSRLYP